MTGTPLIDAEAMVVTQAQAVAAKLTEAQRRALLEAHDIDFAHITRLNSHRSAKALHARGLTNLSWAPSGLTSLGLAVRAALSPSATPE